jgi:hypothetical protein
MFGAAWLSSKLNLAASFIALAGIGDMLESRRI